MEIQGRSEFSFLHSVMMASRRGPSTGHSHAHGKTNGGDYARHLVGVSVMIMKAIRNDLGMPLVNEGMLSNFVSTLLRHSGVSYSTLLCGLLYLLRFRHALPTKNGDQLKLKSTNPLYVMVMFVVSLMLGSKFLHDRHASNQAWAQSAYLPVELVNAAEIDFLHIIQHRLHVDQVIFQRWVAYLFQPRQPTVESKLRTPMASVVPSAASSPLSYEEQEPEIIIGMKRKSPL